MAGAPLRALIKKSPKMISESIMALLAQRGATSLVARAPESAGDKGDEGTSQPTVVTPKTLDVEPDSSVNPPKNEVVDLSTEKERKRHRKNTDGSSHSHRKKSKSHSSSKAVGATQPSKAPVTGSFPQAMATAKGHLDQVRKKYLPLCLLPFVFEYALYVLTLDLVLVYFSSACC